MKQVLGQMASRSGTPAGRPSVSAERQPAGSQSHTALGAGPQAGAAGETEIIQPHARTSPWRGLRFTFTGLLAVVVVLVVGLAALHSETNLLFLLFGIGTGALLISLVVPVLMVRHIEVTRTLPHAVVAGRPFPIVYTIRHGGRWMRAWCLVIGEKPIASHRARFPLSWVGSLLPGEEQRFEVASRCPIRGRILLEGVRVSSRFPFGLMAAETDTVSPAELVVYPAVGRLRRDPWKGRDLAEAAASRSAQDRSGSEEFYGVREYRQGDNLKWIHWRGSARLGRLVVREHVPLRATQVIVLVDPWPLGEPEPPTGPRWRMRWGAVAEEPIRPPDHLAERLIAAAATAVCDGLERGHRVGLIACGRVPVAIPPAGGRAHRRRLLHELALLEPGPGEALGNLLARVRWTSGWHARCLLCTPRMTETHHRVARFLGTRAEAVRIAAPGTEWLETVFMPASSWLPEGGAA